MGRNAEQLLITSRDQLFEARRVTLSDGAKQVIMSTTDASLQQFIASQINK